MSWVSCRTLFESNGSRIEHPICCSCVDRDAHPHVDFQHLMEEFTSFIHIVKYIDNICWIRIICIWKYLHIKRYTNVLLNWSNKIHRGGSTNIPCSGETIGFKFISTLPGTWAWYVARPGDGQMQSACIGNCSWNVCGMDGMRWINFCILMKIFLSACRDDIP